MKLTESAHAELSRLLFQSRVEGYDGFAVYWANQTLQEPADPGQPIWKTQEQTGWKLKLVPVAHLPLESLHEVSGLRFFLGSDRNDHELDFRDQTLLLDGESVKME